MRQGIRLRPLVAAGLCFTLGVALAEEVEWEYEFEFFAPPQELDASWHHRGDGQAEIRDGKLVLTSNTDGGIYFANMAASGLWDGDQPTTVEFRARAVDVDTGSDAAAHLIVKSDDFAFVFNLVEPEFTTYRIVLEMDQAFVYEVGSGNDPIALKPERLERELYTEEELRPNSIGFGDWSNQIGGVSEWEFIRWTNQGAFAPSH